MARSKYERKAQKELEKEGWTVDWKIRPRINPRNYNVDFFGLFDLVAQKEDEPIRWISIKGRAGVPGKHLQELQNFKLPRSGHVKEVWWIRRTSKKWGKKIIP